MTATMMSVAQAAPGSRAKLAVLRAGGGEPDGPITTKLREIAGMTHTSMSVRSSGPLSW